MNVEEHGFSIIDIGPYSEDIVESFSDLALDIYMGNGNRYRRFSQYKMHYSCAGWKFELLPHRPYMTFSKYNSVAGGIKRFYEPLQVDFTSHIKQGAEKIPLDTTKEWQINVHQYRVIVDPILRGVTVPEGRHQDGHSFVMIAVVTRRGIYGAEMSLYRNSDDVVPIHKAVLLENQAALLNDKQLFHDVTEIFPIEDDGYRDIYVVAFSPWEDRWHGEEFEQKVITSEKSEG